MKMTLRLKIKLVAGISRTFYLSIETIRRPPQSRETIPLKAVLDLEMVQHCQLHKKLKVAHLVQPGRGSLLLERNQGKDFVNFCSV
jgi:hypothetical protein